MYNNNIENRFSDIKNSKNSKNRKFRSIDNDQFKICIVGLPLETTLKDVRILFKDYGRIKIDMPSKENRINNNKIIQIAFVKFSNRENYDSALKFNGMLFNDHILNISVIRDFSSENKSKFDSLLNDFVEHNIKEISDQLVRLIKLSNDNTDLDNLAKLFCDKTNTNPKLMNLLRSFTCVIQDSDNTNLNNFLISIFKCKLETEDI